MASWLIIITFIMALVGGGAGVGIDIGACSDQVFDCRCGTPGHPFPVRVPQCTFFYKWVPYCGPCDKEKEETVCGAFTDCMDCSREGCTTCPPGKYGPSCRGECRCQNGGMCDPNNGACTCLSAFAGKFCDVIVGNVTTVAPPLLCSEPELGRESSFTATHGPTGKFSRGTQLRYRCTEGYLLVGSTVITCDRRGSWSSSPPVCERSCRIPALTAHLGISIINTQETSNYRRPLALSAFTVGAVNETGMPVLKNTRINFRCVSSFYRLVGTRQATCTGSGTWSKDIPTCVPECGISGAPQTSLIINGTRANPDAWPWMVSLFLTISEGDISFGCGGTLINENWVVTAAHCITRERTNEVLEPSSVLVYAGDFQIENEEDREQEREVSMIMMHPQYEPMTLDFDIALLRLAEPVELSEHVQPICLPNGREVEQVTPLTAGVVGKVTGWGRTATGHASNFLQEVSLPIVSTTACRRAFQADGFIISDNMFCAGNGTGITDVCRGDSGGPYVYSEIVGRRTRWFLRGVVSWSSPRGCATRGLYSGFTNIERFIDWIEDNIDL